MGTANRLSLLLGLVTLALGSCQGVESPASPPGLVAIVPTVASAATSVSTSAPGPATPLSPAQAVQDPAQTAVPLNADDWETWPIVPAVPDAMKELFQQGQALGNDPHAFSVFGDCQSTPDVFMGVYDTDPTQVSQLPPALRDTVSYFAGSFNRESPTSRSGTTAGALLWDQWTEGKYGCAPNETPVDCELRVQRPSFVLIMVGTHYESRNIDYLRTILNDLLGHGVVPILATKADDRELDDHLNQDMAVLALQDSVPLWNFWASVKDQPNHDLYTKPIDKHLGDIYLNDDGLERHRFTGLEALDAVRRAVGDSPSP